MSLPPEGIVAKSKSRPGRVFYYNKLTKQTRWEKPIGEREGMGLTCSDRGEYWEGRATKGVTGKLKGGV